MPKPMGEGVLILGFDGRESRRRCVAPESHVLAGGRVLVPARGHRWRTFAGDGA